MDGTNTQPLNQGTYHERMKGVKVPPANMPPSGPPFSVRRERPGPLKHDTGVLSSVGWLPEGLFPELDELRREHHALLNEVRAYGGAFSDLETQYAEEDEAREATLFAAEGPSPVTGGAERADALKEAEARHWAKVVELAAFCERAIGVIEEKWGKLPEFPDEPGVKLPEWRQVFATQKLEINEVIEQAKEVVRNAEREEAAIIGKERWLDRTSGQKANAGRYMAADDNSQPPTRAELEARRLPESMREGVAA